MTRRIGEFLDYEISATGLRVHVRTGGRSLTRYELVHEREVWVNFQSKAIVSSWFITFLYPNLSKWNEIENTNFRLTIGFCRVVSGNLSNSLLLNCTKFLSSKRRPSGGTPVLSRDLTIKTKDMKTWVSKKSTLVVTPNSMKLKILLSTVLSF